MVIRKGIYKHYKGGKYLVYGTARYREDPDAVLVIYQEMDKDNILAGEMLLRPVELFVEDVITEDSLILRFQLIEPKDDLIIDNKNNFYADKDGNQYDLLCEAKNDVTGADMVIYRAVNSSQNYEQGILWTTLKEIFFGSESDNDGDKAKRFVKVGV